MRVPTQLYVYKIMLRAKAFEASPAPTTVVAAATEYQGRKWVWVAAESAVPPTTASTVPV